MRAAAVADVLPTILCIPDRCVFEYQQFCLCGTQETQNRQGSFTTYPLSVNENAADQLMSGQLPFRVALPCAPGSCATYI